MSGREDGSLTSFLTSRMTRVRAADDSQPARTEVGEYCELVSDAILNRGFADSLFNVSPRLLSASDAVIYSLRYEHFCPIEAALHIAPDSDNSGPFFWINGLVKAAGSPSVAVQELMIRVINDIGTTYSRATRLKACYRIFRDGYIDARGISRSENKGSALLFSDFRFKTVGIETVMIKGTEQDAHLFPSADPDGKSFRVVVVRSRRGTYEIAKNYLIPPVTGSA